MTIDFLKIQANKKEQAEFSRLLSILTFHFLTFCRQNFVWLYSYHFLVIWFFMKKFYKWKPVSRWNNGCAIVFLPDQRLLTYVPFLSFQSCNRLRVSTIFRGHSFLETSVKQPKMVFVCCFYRVYLFSYIVRLYQEIIYT